MKIMIAMIYVMILGILAFVQRFKIHKFLHSFVPAILIWFLFIVFTAILLHMIKVSLNHFCYKNIFDCFGKNKNKINFVF